MQKASRPLQDRTMVVACLAEVAQGMGAPIAGYVDVILLQHDTFLFIQGLLFGSSNIFSIFSESSSHVSESDALSNQGTRII